jgi:hypothetical protein
MIYNNKRETWVRASCAGLPGILAHLLVRLLEHSTKLKTKLATKLWD